METTTNEGATEMTTTTSKVACGTCSDTERFTDGTDSVCATCGTTRDARTPIALRDALESALVAEDDLTTDELNLLHAVFAEQVTEVGAVDAARMAVEEVLEG